MKELRVIADTFSSSVCNINGTTPSYLDHLLKTGVDGAIICGEAGDGGEMCFNDRQLMCVTWARAVSEVLSNSQFSLWVHVGYTNLPASMVLAEQAQQFDSVSVIIGATPMIKPKSLDGVVAYCRAIANKAPEKDFYFHYNPAFGPRIDLVLTIENLLKEVKTFRGVLYYDDNIDMLDRCLSKWGKRLDIVLGRDSIMDYGVQGGATCAGQVVNFRASFYRELWQAVVDKKRSIVRSMQLGLDMFLDSLVSRGEDLPAALRYITGKAVPGLYLGEPRLPNRPLTELQKRKIDELANWFLSANDSDCVDS